MRELLAILDDFDAWSEPRDGVGDNPFRVACKLEEAATEQEIQAAWGDRRLPPELITLWTRCRAGRLFEDIDYGQWGLRILSPADSAARTASEYAVRPDDLGPEDIVLAEFLGDQDLLVVSPRPEGEGGDVLVALPLDSREDWYRPALTLTAFFEQYLSAAGDKYWEARK